MVEKDENSVLKIKLSYKYSIFYFCLVLARVLINFTGIEFLWVSGPLSRENSRKRPLSKAEAEEGQFLRSSILPFRRFAHPPSVELYETVHLELQITQSIKLQMLNKSCQGHSAETK